MLEHSIYSVISPEGCASILWKSASKAPLAAEAMGVTADKSKSLGLIDTIIPEPLGGAHRNMDEMADRLKAQLNSDLNDLVGLDKQQLLDQRYQKLMSFGYC